MPQGWRLWAGFGDWDWTKVKDVVFDSLFCRIYRACKEAFSWTGNKNFRGSDEARAMVRNPERLPRV